MPAASAFGTLALDFDALRAGYPTYNRLPAHIQKQMDDYNKNLPEGAPRNTPCCFQVSEALNVVGGEHKIPARSHRRGNCPLLGNFYLGSVDELEYYLSGRYGTGEDIKPYAKGAKNPITAMKAHIAGKHGILAFRDTGLGAHTELWDGSDIIQNGAPAAHGAALSQGFIFGRNRVLFWECTGDDGVAEAPGWITGWWHVNDGQEWYYHFSSQYVVSFMQAKPEGPFDMPARKLGNEGRFAIDPGGLTLRLDWKAIGDGVTLETFDLASPTPVIMQGKSNRYAPLTARKIMEWPKKK